MIELYAEIQRKIIQFMLDLLSKDNENINQWEIDRLNDAQSLEDYAVNVLMAYKPMIKKTVKDLSEDASKLVMEHILNEFDTEVEIDASIAQQDVFSYLDLYILRGLISNQGKIGTLVRDYEALINAIVDDARINDKSLKQAKVDNIPNKLENGLNSGYIDKSDNEWKLDRYVLTVGNAIYQNTINRGQNQIQQELVKVFHYPKPREACKSLEASGVICVVPRSQASEYAQRFPNIHDREHMYGEAGGHRGINCRHVWHSVESKQDLGSYLYAEVDRMREKLYAERDKLKELLSLN